MGKDVAVVVVGPGFVARVGIGDLLLAIVPVIGEARDVAVGVRERGDKTVVRVTALFGRDAVGVDHRRDAVRSVVLELRGPALGIDGAAQAVEAVVVVGGQFRERVGDRLHLVAQRESPGSRLPGQAELTLGG